MKFYLQITKAIEKIFSPEFINRLDESIVYKPLNKKDILPLESEALHGRDEEVEVPSEHFVKGTPLKGPFADNLQIAVFGMGWFWGVERRFWELEGVFSTSAGYSGGFTKNPTYREVCTGMTGHNEVVLVVYDPELISYESLLITFWEDHKRLS